MLPAFSRRLPLVLVAFAVGSLFLLPALAADGAAAPKKPAEDEPAANPYLAAVSRSAAKPGGEAKVYRNEDLYKLFGAAPQNAEVQAAAESEEAPPTEASPGVTAPPATEADAASPTYDPLKELLDQQASAQEQQKKTVEAEGRLRAAQENVAEIEKRIRSVRNPYLAREAPPEKEAEEWNRMDAAARVERSEDELRQAREQLAAAEAELGQLRGTAP